MHYRECLYHLLPFFATQIINPFLTSSFPVNHDKGVGFLKANQLIRESIYLLMFLQCRISFIMPHTRPLCVFSLSFRRPNLHNTHKSYLIFVLELYAEYCFRNYVLRETFLTHLLFHTHSQNMYNRSIYLLKYYFESYVIYK